jgi:DNA modification methylase
LILDCYSGSATTAVACHELGRNYTCIEIDSEYHKASVERLTEAKRQTKIFNMADVQIEQMRFIQ